MINFNLEGRGGKFIESQDTVFQGEYTDFSAKWYGTVGIKIIMTFIIELPLPHGFPTIVLMIDRFRRWADRGYTSDKKKSNLVLQDDYEELNTGDEFMLDYRLG